MSSDDKPHILLGLGGHARVLIECARMSGLSLTGYVAPECSGNHGDLNYLGTDDAILSENPSDIVLINGLGSLPGDNRSRSLLFEHFKSMSYRFATLIHPSAYISPSASFAEGVQVMAHCAVQAQAHVKANSIINTAAVLEHHVAIGEHCHVAPGCVLCGSVSVGHYSHIGAGSVVLQQVEIENHVVIGAASCVRKTIRAHDVYFERRAKRKLCP